MATSRGKRADLSMMCGRETRLARQQRLVGFRPLARTPTCACRTLVADTFHLQHHLHSRTGDANVLSHSIGATSSPYRGSSIAMPTLDSSAVLFNP